MKNASEKILHCLSLQGDKWLGPKEINEQTGINNLSYTSRLLSDLVLTQKVLRKKEGRFAYYKQNHHVFFEGNLDLTEIEESQIFLQIRAAQSYINLVPDRVSNIFSFAFTEMLNNAIDHSQSKNGYAKAWEEQGILKFTIRDHGIGIFRNIMNCRGLKNEHEAIQDLMKGKTTTQPRNHTGEGIFWTSRMSDTFSIKSFDLALHINNLINDYTIEKYEPEEHLTGTEIHFEIALNSEKSMVEIFNTYSTSHDASVFDTTEIPLRLYDSGDFWVSRSQAKRILNGLEKYKKIIIDFKGINLVGQGFADEIFRVFSISHPEIIIEPTNMNDSVRMMVERAINDPTGRN